MWLPEATDPSEYSSSVPWAERDIDVLELGRKSNSFHGKIAAPLANAKRSHLFERVKGEIIFPDRKGFLEGLARSKISICFPCSQTHPERFGSVETVTNRYFESMASKCLIVGHAPRQLTDLFGYNPVIEVQEGADFEQIEFLLRSPGLILGSHRKKLQPSLAGGHMEKPGGDGAQDSSRGSVLIWPTGCLQESSPRTIGSPATLWQATGSLQAPFVFRGLSWESIPRLSSLASHCKQAVSKRGSESHVPRQGRYRPRQSGSTVRLDSTLEEDQESSSISSAA